MINKERMDMPDKKSDVKVVKMGAWSPGPGCHGGCGVKLFIKDGKLLKLKEMKTIPISRADFVPDAWL